MTKINNISSNSYILPLQGEKHSSELFPRCYLGLRYTSPSGRFLSVKQAVSLIYFSPRATPRVLGFDRIILRPARAV